MKASNIPCPFYFLKIAVFIHLFGKMHFKLALIFLFVFCFKSSVALIEPEQVHLSYGVEPSEMIVTWTTFDPTNSSIVQYGISGYNLNAEGSITKFVDGGEMKRVIFIHRVVVTDLKPNTVYLYRCGSPEGWGTGFRFQTRPLGLDWSPRLVILGDMGVSNAQSLPRIIEDVQNGLYDAALHVGDMAYDMDENDGMKGDEFVRMIEPIAANIPYMTCVGNHENAYNFSHYVNRFTMLNQQGEMNNHFYSYNLGRAHIIAFSTEFYFFVEYGLQQITNQLNWLENDLMIASSPENRAKYPWIITMAHRPMYCSTLDHDDCTLQQSVIRHGLEDLFYKYGVDLEFWAHEHVYERMFPVYNEKTYNGSYDNPYTNPKAPVHITTGSAGCRERTDKFVKKPYDWSAFRSSDYGYTRLHIINNTHIYMEQMSDDQGKVIDKMLLIKEIHGPEAWDLSDEL